MNWLRKIFGRVETASGVDVSPAPTPVEPVVSPIKELDAFAITIDVMAAAGHVVERVNDHLLHAPSGIWLVPQWLESATMPSGHVRSSSQIKVMHPAFGKEGVFEYQHAGADTLEQAFRAALLGWVEMDFVVLLDAVLPKARHSKVMLMTFPSPQNAGERRRRILLGPVAHLRNVTQGSGENAAVLDPGEHDFCPCCLLTKNYDAFQNLFNDGEFHAIRLFAVRHEDGTLNADCRVNGEDFEQGEASLLRYAGSWPQQGMEYRKQYVVIQDYVQAAVQA